MPVRSSLMCSVYCNWNQCLKSGHGRRPCSSCGRTACESRSSARIIAIHHDLCCLTNHPRFLYKKKGPQLRGPALTSCAYIGLYCPCSSSRLGAIYPQWQLVRSHRLACPGKAEALRSGSVFSKNYELFHKESLLSYWWLHWIIRSKSTGYLWQILPGANWSRSDKVNHALRRGQRRADTL